MEAPNFITSGFVAGFSAGAFELCRTEFECTITELKARMTNPDLMTRLSDKLFKVRECLVSKAHLVKSDYPCKDPLSEETPYFKNGAYDGKALYDGLTKNHPEDHLRKLMYACTLLTLCRNVGFDSTEVHRVSSILNALWPEYVGQTGFCKKGNYSFKK